jgi:hypothetical protein
MAQRLGAGQRVQRGGQAGVHADQRAAVGLVLAVHVAVGRALGQRLHRRRHRRQRADIDSSAPSSCTSVR